MKQILIEEAFEPEIIVESKDGQKNYYIEGIFSTIGQRNRNQRIYPRQLWESNVQKFQEYIKNNDIHTLGEWDHPARVEPDPMKAVIKIEKLYIEDDYVKGRAKVLNDGSYETNKIKALIDEGMKIGISSRGTGKLGKGGIVEEFTLSTYDLVPNPTNASHSSL